MGRWIALAGVVFSCSTASVRAEHLGEWQQTTQLAEPVDAAFVGAELWVLERASARIVVLDARGDEVRAFGGSEEAVGGLSRPNAFAVGAELVYIADTDNHRIQTFTHAGHPVGSWGRAGTLAGEFRRPHDVALSADRVLVADTDNHRIQVFTLAGLWRETIGHYGHAQGEFDRPVSVAANRRGEVYVADARNQRLQRFGAEGRFLASWGARGTAAGLFLEPAALAWAGGRLFATDRLGGRAQVFDLHGKLLYTWGHEPASAREHKGALHEPEGIAVDERAGRAVVCEPLENRIQWFSTEGQGAEHEPHEAGHDPLPAFGPGGALGGSRLALIDRLEASVVVFDIESVGLVRLGTLGGFGTSLGRFSDPRDVAVDGADGSILVSDSGQRRITRFRLDPQFGPDDPRVATTVRSRSFEPVAKLSVDDRSLAFEPGPITLGPEGCVWVGDSRQSTLARLSPQLATLELVAPTVEASSGFVDLAWHARDECLYALLDSPRSLLVLDADGAERDVFELARPWRPRSVAVASNGEVIVTDAARQCVLALRSGRVVRECGQPGWGPGEFAGIDAAFPYQDRLYVLDRRQRRGQVLTTEGRFLVAFGHGH